MTAFVPCGAAKAECDEILDRWKREERVLKALRYDDLEQAFAGAVMRFCYDAVRKDPEAIAWVESARFTEFGRAAGWRIGKIEDLRASVLEAARDPRAKRGVDLVLRSPAALTRMRERGLSERDIAAELGVSRGSVRRALQRHTKERAA